MTDRLTDEQMAERWADLKSRVVGTPAENDPVLVEALELAADICEALRSRLTAAERERNYQHGRADRNAKEHAAQQARAEAAEARVDKLEGALAQAKAEIVAADVANDRNPHGYRTDAALWASRAVSTIDEALALEDRT